MSDPIWFWLWLIAMFGWLISRLQLRRANRMIMELLMKPELLQPELLPQRLTGTPPPAAKPTPAARQTGQRNLQRMRDILEKRRGAS